MDRIEIIENILQAFQEGDYDLAIMLLEKISEKSDFLSKRLPLAKYYYEELTKSQKNSSTDFDKYSSQINRMMHIFSDIIQYIEKISD